MKKTNDLNDKEAEAVRELISKLPPEDLERAAGGISPQARNILVALGAITIVTTTGLVLANKVGGGGTNSIDLGTKYNTIKDDEIMSNDRARLLIKQYNISETLVNSKEVDGENYPCKVFSKWTYFNKSSDGKTDLETNLKHMKKGFCVIKDKDGKIRVYHGDQVRNGGATILHGEYKRGVEYDLLLDEI